ncbi:MAG: hypothetical protein Tsb0020_08980 [Haliangiales bacterium]
MAFETSGDMEHAGDPIGAGSRRRRRDTDEILARERSRERERMLAAAHRERATPRYRSLVMHWLGSWLRRPRSVEPAAELEVGPGQVAIGFGGHATALIRYQSLSLVCDPMLGRWVKGIKRAQMPGYGPEDMRDVELILISHGHADHLHRDTLAALPRGATVVVPPRTAHRVSDLGFARVVELEVGQSIQHRGVDVTTAAVCHGDRALSYVIRGDGPSVYFCADSGYFSGFADIGRELAPDIALLPIGGYYPLSFRERHMSPLDALYALEDLRARLMIPIHHGAFALSYEHLDEPRRWLDELVRERGLEDFVIPLLPGQSRLFVPPRRRQNPLSDEPGEVGAETPAGAGRSALRASSAALDEALEQALDKVFDDSLDRALGATAAGEVVAATRPAQSLPDRAAAQRLDESGLHKLGTPAWVGAMARRGGAAWGLPDGAAFAAPAWTEPRLVADAEQAAPQPDSALDIEVPIEVAAVEAGTADVPIELTKMKIRVEPSAADVPIELTKIRAEPIALRAHPSDAVAGSGHGLVGHELGWEEGEFAVEFAIDKALASL